MQHNKYQELKDLHDGLEKMVKTVDARTQSQHKLLQSILVLMKNYDARLLTLQKIAFQHDLTNEEDFSDRVDTVLGLRRREEGETVEIGDVAWVKYTANFDGKQETEENLPLRIGSGSVVFEQALVGKKVGDKGIEFIATLKEDKGEVKFSIDILKAKVKTAENTEGVEDGDGERVEEPRTDVVGSGAEVNAGGVELSP